MDEDHAATVEKEQLLDEVLFAYLREAEAGRTPERHEWLARYPELAGELTAFLADQERLERLAAPLRQVVHPGRVDDTPGPGANLTFGDYELEAVIGQGGMGVVYRARQKSLDRVLALKMIRAGSLATSEDVERFRNEARAAAALDHPNIVPVYEVGEQQGQLYFSMKLIEGGSLAGHLPRFRHDPRGAARLVQTVARAVHHAHQRGILHRDLKPANILLDAGDQPHITDLGLCKRMAAEEVQTRTGQLVGTPAYMAPEQATGPGSFLTPAVDVHALGVILYELLTGQPPFRGDTPLQTLEQVVACEPVSLRRRNPGVPRELETICHKCLEKEPGKRYGSALELADDLGNFLEDRPIQARRQTLVQRVGKWARRHRTAVVAAVVCLVVTLAAAAGSAGWVLGERAARQREAEARVVEALEAAKPGLEQGNPHDPTLITAVQRAQAQVDSGVVGAALREQVEQLRRDVEMLVRLENARLQVAAAYRKTGVDLAGADRLYAKAFEWYGVEGGSTLEEVAEVVRNSAIRSHLISGMDNWNSIRIRLKLSTGYLLRVAILADDDPWRQQVRGAAMRGDHAALERLAEEQDTGKQAPDTLVLLANTLRHAGNGTAAEGLLRRAQQRHPADFHVNFSLAYALSRQPSASKAEVIRFYQAALALRPHSPIVHHNLGNAFREASRLVEAEAACRKAIELQPDLALAHVGLGNTLSDQRRWAAAEAEFRKAIELQPTLAEAYYDFGLSLLEQKKWADAERMHRKATLLQPDHAEAHRNLAIALLERGKLADAESACRASLKLQPRSAEAHSTLGTVLHDRGKLLQAEAAQRQAIVLNPNLAEVHSNLGTVLQDRGKLEEAIDEHRLAVRLKPDSPLVHYCLGTALYASKQFDEAIASFRRALQLQKDYPDAHNYLGIVHHQKGQHDEAIACFRQAIALKTDDADAHNNLGLALRARRLVDEAISEFKQAIRFKKDYAEAHNNLGAALQARGELDEAIACFRQAIRLQKDYAEAHNNLTTTLQWKAALAKLPLILKGEAQPADAAECVVLATVCQMPFQKLYAASARFHEEAFSRQAALADIPGQRYNAACAAALAGCGQSKDAADLPDKERVRLRRQALTWLRADLAAWRRLLEKDTSRAGPIVLQQMRHWQQDSDFAGVRGDAVARLPEAEREGWRQLWTDVADTLARASKSVEHKERKDTSKPPP
jgi:serine/threonine-protein kinase